MSLVVATLINNFSQLGPTVSTVNAASAMAAAYADYCRGAITPAGGGLGPASVAAGQAATEQALATLFATGTPASAATQMATAFAAFWPPTVFLFSAPATGPGISAPPTGTSLLANQISIMAPVPVASGALIALCTAIDVMCRTVLVTFPGPGTPIISPVV